MKQLTEILHEANRFKSMVAQMRMKSPLYPEIYKEINGGTLCVTTMVEFTFRDIVFKRHCLETGYISATNPESWLVQRLHTSALDTIQKGVPYVLDEIVKVNNISIVSEKNIE